MMVLKLLATLIYNIVLWGGVLSYITFGIDWKSVAAMLLYPLCMPVLFHLVYFIIFPKKELEIKWRVCQVFMQIIITVIFTVITSAYIRSSFGPYRGFMSPGGKEDLYASIIGVLSTIGFIITRITSSIWLEWGVAGKRGRYMTVLKILAMVVSSIVLWMIFFIIIHFL